MTTEQHLQVQKDRNWPSKIRQSAKIAFKNEGEMEIFQQTKEDRIHCHQIVSTRKAEAFQAKEN